MPITIDYQQVVLPPTNPATPATPGDDFDDDDYGDACSILVPIDIAATDSLRAMTAAGTELREDPSNAWRSDLTYPVGARVHTASNHQVYESVKEGNQDKDPSQDVNRYNAAGIATWWTKVGPTNRYAMFDGLVSSQTSAPSPLSITLTPGAFNGIALFGMEADTYDLVIRETPGGPVVYSEISVALDGAQPTDYYEYFFDRPKPLRQFIRTGLTPYSSGEVTLTLYNGSGAVKLGMFAIGDVRELGVPQRAAVASPQDFSYIKTDDFGNTSVRKRANATGLRIPVVVRSGDVNFVHETVKEILGVPTVVIGSQAVGYEWLTVFGLISGDMSAGPFPYSTLTLNVKGLI